MFYTRNQSTWNSLVGTVAGHLHPILILLGLLLKPHELVELRLLAAQGGKDCLGNGYFDNPVRLAEAATRWDGQVGALGFSINPVRRSLLIAAENRIRRPACWMSDGGDITRRCLLPINFQVEASASGSTRQTALDMAHECRDFLSTQSWPEPVVADGGNAAHLLFAIDLPNDTGSTELMKQTLTAMSERFSNDLIRIDTNASYAALLLPLYGTLLRQPSTTPETPYRRSAILTLPDQVQPVDRVLLETLVRLPVAASRPFYKPLIPVAGDPIPLFVQTKCIIEASAWTPTGILYDAFQIFGYDHALPTVAAPQFARALVTRFGLEPHRRKVHGKVVRGLRGIRLRSTGPDSR